MPDDKALGADIDLLRSAAEEAGIIALSFFRKNPKSWIKGRASSVSEADMAVDAYLKEALLAARPDHGWLSEETADTAERLGKKRIFVVDPIDGTKGYLEGNENWCIALAIIEDDSPIAGVVHAPALAKTYYAERGAGAFCNGRKLDSSTENRSKELPCAGVPKDERWSAFLSCKRAPFVPSLALRLVRVASGELGAAFSRPNAYDWDIAGAHLIIEEAGGLFIDATGRIPLYNRKALTHPALGAFGIAARAMFEQ